MSKGCDILIGGRIVRLATMSFLLIGFAFTSSSALSYWKEVTVSRDIELVTIGEAIDIVINDLNENAEKKYLVPNGYVSAMDETDQIILEYNVSVSRELLNAVDLHINIKDILVDDNTEYSHLVDITILGISDEVVLDLYNSTLLVTVEIKLIEPIDINEAIDNGIELDLVNTPDSVQGYLDMSGKDIIFTLSFELQSKEQLIDEEASE